MNNLTIVLLTAGVMCVIFGTVVFLVIKRMRSQMDGYLNISKRDPSKVYQLEIATDPDELRKQNYIVLKVRKVSDL